MPPIADAGQALETCLLPPLRLGDAARLQDRLAYEMGEAPRRRGTLLLTEHPPAYTVGRQGTAEDVLDDDPVLPRHWVARGGGAWLHGPGQLAIYLIVPIAPRPGALAEFRDALYGGLLDVLDELDVPAERDHEHGGIVVRGRQIAGVGVSVKDWVAGHGAVLNVALPDDRLAAVRATPGVPERRQTCLLRERLLPVRPQELREAVARRLAARLGFSGIMLVPPPMPLRPPPRTARRHAIVR